MEKSVRDKWSDMFKRQKNAPEGWLKRQEWIAYLNIGDSTFDDRMKLLRKDNRVKEDTFVDEKGYKRKYIWINEISPLLKKKLPKSRSNT